MNTDAKKIYRNYVWGTRLILGSFLLFFALCIFFSEYLQGILSLLPLVVAFGVFFLNRWRRSRLADLLERDLDAVTYDQVLCFFKNGDPLGGAAYWTGRYGETHLRQKSVYLAVEDPRPRILAASGLANLYFELGEEERLREICLQFPTLDPKNVAAGTVKIYQPIFDFYGRYLAGEYAVCREIMLRRKESAGARQRLMQVRCDFALALIAYREGKLSEAREGFSEVLRQAPRLHYATLVPAYLQAVDSGAPFASMAPELPEPDSEMLEEMRTVPKKERKNRLLLLGWLIVPLLILVILVAASQASKLELQRFYEDSVVSAGYESPEILAEFSLADRDGTELEWLVLCNTSDAGLVLGTSVYYEFSPEITYFIPVCENVVPGVEFSGIGDFSGRRITVRLYEKKSEMPSDFYCYRKFKLDGKTYYLCIADVAPAEETSA